MNNERYNQIIDEVYENYLGGGHIKWLKPREYDTPMGKINVPTPYSKEELVDKCKTDPEFSEKWGLKIEERELTTVRERKKYDKFYDDLIGERPEHHKTLDNRGVPRKIITVTYKDEKTEVYES